MSKNDKKIQQLDKALATDGVSSLQDLDDFGIDVCFPMSAGIDIGCRRNYVAVSRGIARQKGIEVVHDFGTTCAEHDRCVEFLKSLGVTHVAMESTGHYWQILCSKLTDAGISVEVVNPRHFRMVPGRKTDVKDCQWLQVLHEHGLLRGSFIPQKTIQELRTLIRLRAKVIDESSQHVNRMQRSLVLMNVMLRNVVSDITGVTGLKIVDAIVSGERDPLKLAALRDGHCKKTSAEIAEALRGTWRNDLVFTLGLERKAYADCQRRLKEVDEELVKTLESLPDAARPAEKILQDTDDGPKRPRSRSKNDLHVEADVAAILERKIGMDLTRLPGFGVLTVLSLVCEVGYDMSRFPDSGHFAAYLGLAPRNKITGGKVISSKTDRISHPAGVALKKIVPSISQGKSHLASAYHRIKGRRGTAKAITATARRLAVSYYDALTHGVEYVLAGVNSCEEKAEKDRMTKTLKKAYKMGILNDQEYKSKMAQILGESVDASAHGDIWHPESQELGCDFGDPDSNPEFQSDYLMELMDPFGEIAGFDAQVAF